jgi:protein dithiol oxidoreductase (disulfide-forming)
MTRLLGMLLAACSLAAVAAGGEPIEGVDYELLTSPQRPADASRIEVLEFFYYGCESCARLEPRLEAWLQRKPADVDFRRLPALRRSDWIPLTRVFFVLDELGVLPRLHGEVYRAVHVEQRDLRRKSGLLEWAESKGLTAAAVERALTSDATAIKIEKARDLTNSYGVRVTPTLIVDGLYLTSAGMLGDIDQVVPVVEGLIEKARRDHAGAR